MEKSQETHNLYPKFNKNKGTTFINSSGASFLSNYYAINMNKENKILYQYSIAFEPQIPDDTNKISDKIIDSLKKDLRQSLGYICYKARMLWGNKKKDIPYINKTEITVQGEKQHYQIILKPNTEITIQDFIGKDQKNLMKLSQVLNVNTKNVLRQIGFKELDKGKYYHDDQFGTDIIKEAGLSVWRGYQINLVTIEEKLFIKADVCSRVLRVESLLETMKQTGKINDKNFINNMLQGKSIITRYGNHKIYSIQSIDYNMTPKSLFPEYRENKKPTFIEYYKNVYNTTIKQINQPLIQVKVRNQDKFQTVHLIPQLVVLTGLTDQQRSDFHLMKSVDQKTKLKVDQRVKETNKIIRLLNKQEKKTLMFTIEEKAHKISGNIISAPIIKAGNKKIQPQNGSFRLNNIQDPIDLKQYFLVYTVRGDRDYNDVDATIKMLQDASKAFGIRVDKPIEIDIKVKKNQRLTAKDWIHEIQLENKNGKPKFVIIYFNKDQMKDKKLYEGIKSHLIHEMHLGSQVITKKTLCQGAKGGLSKASKILLQINDKMGHPLYKVQKQHPFFKNNSIALGGLAVSKGSKGYFASLVGTRNNQMTQHFSDFNKINCKQIIAKQILFNFVLNWIKKYFDTENKKLPKTIIIYRQGLNQKQALKVLEQQIKIFFQAFQKIKQKSKCLEWKPNLIYLLVNQKTGTRIYDVDKNNYLSNPLPGTIIGSQISKNGAYEFLMASAATSQGTCNMVQYKVAYDSSNQQVPHQGLKILTYEQCYNYPNWTGSIRFPASLQKANKLAKLAATFGQDKIDKNNPLKDLDYYI